jgi:HPt (histidine-containing phosphotransfer) domain-containing protein
VPEVAAALERAGRRFASAGPASETSIASDEVLDPHALDELRAHAEPGFNAAAELAARFLESTPTRLAWARRAAEAGDAPAVRREADTIEDGCRQVGAARMRRFAERLQRTAAEDRLADAGAILEDLDRQFDLVRAVFAGRGLG